MNKFIALIPAVLLVATTWAQSPEKMSYQAVVRDASNNLVTNQAIGMQISILQGSASGIAVYVETQAPTTNANGLVSLEIGTGITNNNFSAINWANGPYFIKTETDPTTAGGTNFTITGISQLLSVPYALYAKTAESITGTVNETDPVFSSSQAANITAADITNLGNTSGINTGDQDLTGLASQSALEDTASNIRANIPDVSGLISTETDPVFGAWDKDYDDLTNTPTTITSAQIDAIMANNGKDTTGIYHANRAALDLVSGTNTGDQDISSIATNTQAIKDTAAQIRADIPDVSGLLTSETDPNVPIGTQPGQMQYWNGTAWVTVAAGNDGQFLTFVGGVPTWKTPGLIDIENPTTGKIWMDRNLGAMQVATSSTDPAAYGDLYQWGRAADGHESRTSTTTSTLSSSDTPGNGNFILLSPPYEYDWRSPRNDNLWQGVSGINNPCPSGYRLPTEAEWEAEIQSWSSYNAAGAFASPLKLSVAGYRDHGDGSLYYVGSLGRYWSSTVAGLYSWYLSFSSSNALIYSYHRGYGFSVRCIKD